MELTINGGTTPANFAARVEGISVEAPPPRVNIWREPATGLVWISWGTGYPSFQVQMKIGLQAEWKPVNAVPQLIGRTYVVKVPAELGVHFFRLWQP